MDRAEAGAKNPKMKLSARIKVFNAALEPGGVKPVQRFRDPAAPKMRG